MAALRLEHITKQFPGVKALNDVTISIAYGELHALCGENGAGKSTLMNIIAGNIRPDHGSMYLDNVALHIDGPQDAFAQGIATVHQHLSLVESLSVAENIFANEHPRTRFGFIQFDKLYEQTSALLKTLNLSKINPRRLVSSLSPAEKQMVEIAKALAKNPGILILDEPTASLSANETRTLFDLLRSKRAAGITIVYISHRLEEIFLLADRISVLKDGKYQGTFDASQMTKDQLISKMVGRELQAQQPLVIAQGADVLLQVRNLSGPGFSNISFQVLRGEILGLAGLVGAGRTEIARTISGINERTEGEIILAGEQLEPSHAADAIKKGIVYLTEDRKSLGLFPEMTIQENIIASAMDRLMPGGVFIRSRMQETSEAKKTQLNIAAYGVEQLVSELSGGNQQKVVLAKCLLTEPLVMIVDEPTHGIDVGAKHEIYEMLHNLASHGKCIIVISSELPELLALCHRVIVIKGGRVSGELSGSAMTEESIIKLAT